MIRRSFSIADAAADWDEQEPGPMELVANISDVMLVLAVALMIALLSHWGADFNEIVAIDASQMQKIDADINNDETSESADGATQYEEVGTVYKDTQTGELYVLGS